MSNSGSFRTDKPFRFNLLSHETLRRKGWPTKADVINTLSLEKLQKELQSKRKK